MLSWPMTCLVLCQVVLCIGLGVFGAGVAGIAWHLMLDDDEPGGEREEALDEPAPPGS